MKQRIEHGFINQRIIDRLNEVGYNQFYEDMRKGYHTYAVKYDFKGHKFETQFEITGTIIEKDKEYYGVRNGNEKQFTLIRRSQNTLQDKFNDWYDKYLEWLNE
jgi:hypothetical protein